MSPLIAKKLNVPANLDGRFLINVNYCNRGKTGEEGLLEGYIIEEIQKDIEGFGIGNLASGGNNGNYGKKRNFKQNFKQQDKQPTVATMARSGPAKSAEHMISVSS